MIKRMWTAVEFAILSQPEAAFDMIVDRKGRIVNSEAAFTAALQAGLRCCRKVGHGIDLIPLHWACRNLATEAVSALIYHRDRRHLRLTDQMGWSSYHHLFWSLNGRSEHCCGNLAAENILMKLHAADIPMTASATGKMPVDLLRRERQKMHFETLIRDLSVRWQRNDPHGV